MISRIIFNRSLISYRKPSFIIIIILICFPVSTQARSEITGYISTDPNQPDKRIEAKPGNDGEESGTQNHAGGGSILFFENRSNSKTNTSQDQPIVKGFDRLPENTLVRDENKRIYIIRGGIKKVIRDLKELWQYRGRPILDLEDSELAAYPTRRFYTGELIRQKGDRRVFVLKNGQKHHIKSLIELQANYPGREIYNIIKEEFIKY